MSASLIKAYFPELTDVQQTQFTKLQELYEFWNQQVNLISRKDIQELYIRHVLHSLAIAKFARFQPNSTILDVGTGGGFPGIPLALFFPESRFYLVDAIGKKVKVVNEIIIALDLKNVTAKHERAENIKEQFDFIVTRAVAPARQIWLWTHQRIKEHSKYELSNGIIALKGGDLRSEMRELNRSYQERSIADYFSEPFFETKKIIYISK